MDPAVVLHLLGTLAALSCSKFEKGVEARLLQQRALDVLAFSAKAMLNTVSYHGFYVLFGL